MIFFLHKSLPGNLQNYDGTIRSSIFNAYPHPITVPVTPVIRLSQAEVDNVRRFAEAIALTVEPMWFYLSVLQDVSNLL